MYCNVQYNPVMGRREALIIDAGGERFRFYYDSEVPELLHITLRHGTTPDDAIRVFFEGAASDWHEDRSRFETATEGYGLYWTRHAHDGSVIVISCFERGDD